MKELFSAVLILMCFSFSVLAMPMNDTVATPTAYPDGDCISVCDTEVMSNSEINERMTVTGGVALAELDNFKPTNDGFKLHSMAMNTPEEVGWHMV